MIHIMSVVIELTFDDEDGEYSVPSPKQVEHMVEAGLYRGAQEMGFDKEIEIEAAHGDLEEAFGIEGYDENYYHDEENHAVIRDVTPKKKSRKK